MKSLLVFHSSIMVVVQQGSVLLTETRLDIQCQNSSVTKLSAYSSLHQKLLLHQHRTELLQVTSNSRIPMAMVQLLLMTEHSSEARFQNSPMALTLHSLIRILT